MSRENVEALQRAYAAFNRGDIDAGLAVLHPDIEWKGPPEAPTGSVWQGHDEVRQFARIGLEPWESRTWTPEEFVEVGEDALLVFVRSRARGAGSGIEIEADTAHVATFRDGKVIRLEMYGDRAEALAAVGLRE